MIRLKNIQFISDQSVRGFTIVELAVSVFIIGILATVGGVKFVGTLQENRVNSAAKRIKADIEMVRQKAIGKSVTLTIQFVSASEQYNIAGLPDPNHPSIAYSVDLSAYPYQSEIVSSSLGGDNDLQFDRYGQPDSGGTITVQAGSYTETVTVDPNTGKVTIP